jgi:hypothetical protein
MKQKYSARSSSPLKLMVQVTVCVGVRTNVSEVLSLVCHVIKKVGIIEKGRPMPDFEIHTLNL